MWAMHLRNERRFVLFPKTHDTRQSCNEVALIFVVILPYQEEQRESSRHGFVALLGDMANSLVMRECYPPTGRNFSHPDNVLRPSVREVVVVFLDVIASRTDRIRDTLTQVAIREENPRRCRVTRRLRKG